MARTKLNLLKKAAEKKRRQVVRLRFQTGVKKLIHARQLTGETLLSRDRVKKICGCVLSRRWVQLYYTPNSTGAFSSSSGCGYCRKHLEKFLESQKR
jgi:hypothetical protein